MKKREQIKRKVVITLSKTFPVCHKNAGEPTGFAESLDSGTKIHTIRRDEKSAWTDRVKDINSGKKYLSIRQWEGKPYNSKQQEIATLENVGIQNITITYTSKDSLPLCWVDKKQIPIEEVAKNDGLPVEAFVEWFFGSKNKATLFEGVIIHFTDFRYGG